MPLTPRQLDPLHRLARRQPWLSLFLKFIDKLRIDSKEIAPEDERGARLELWNTQRLFLEQLATGLDNGQFMFYCLKGRQQGASTITLAILLFWVAVHPRTIAALVCNTEEVRDAFRDTLKRYHESFPENFFGDRFAKVRHNEKHYLFTNGSRIDYLVAGKSRVSWGESRGYSVCLCTEVADYGKEEGLRSFIEALAQTNPDRLFLFEGPLALDTPLPTPGGWTTMGAVSAGDYLFDDRGNPTKVVGTSPILINRNCFEVTFNNGETIVADADHLWRVNERRWYTNQQWTEKDVHTSGLLPGRHMVALPQPLSGAENELPIDPYLLGVWLGDGATAEPRITSGDEDIDEMMARLSSRGHRLGVVTKSANRVGMFFVLGVRAVFAKEGLLGNKHIPLKYLRASEDQRRLLLCGLMDTDGHVNKKTFSCTFASTNRRLIEDVSELLATLGVRHTVKENYQTGKLRRFPGGNISVCQTCWRITFSEFPGRAVFALSRKRARQETPRDPVWRKSKWVTIVSVIPVPSVPVKCVAVESESHLFLAGKTMIPTHNTAKGPNHWQSMWLDSEDEPTICRIFLGWWAHELNFIPRRDPRYDRHGTQAPNGEETELCNAVLERYGHVVTREQLAWWRWKLASSDRQTAEQNQPWLPEQAFVLSGYSFFQTRLLQNRYEEIQQIDEDSPSREGRNGFKAYRFIMGNSFWAMRLEQILDPARLAEVELRIWEDPIREAQYVIGCDPAFGHSEHSDNHCISIFRCYADKLVQVAEYADNRFETKHCAWVLAGLAGAYRNCMVNLELYGPGRVVMNEFDNIRIQLRQDMYMPMNRDNEWDEDFMAGARWFLYRRVDNPGPGFVFNFETNTRRKFELFNLYRDCFTSKILILNSTKLLEEMATMVQEKSDIAPQAPGKQKDDRPFAAALATYAWNEWMRMPLITAGATYERISNAESGHPEGPSQIVDRLVYSYFQRAEEEAMAREDAGPWAQEDWRSARGLL